MNKDSDSGKRGDLIKPSARKGIHEHRNRQFFDQERMGVYSLKSKPRNGDPCAGTSTFNRDEGKDVVDQGMSKFAHTSSPVAARRIKDHKRNSFDASSPQFTDDDNVCTKSLPASLPSHSLSSDEFGSWQEQSDHHNASAASAKSTISQRSQNDTSADQFLTPHEFIIPTISPISNYNNEPRNQEKKSCSQYLIPLLAIAIIVPAYFYGEVLNVVHGTLKQVNGYSEANLYNDLSTLGEKYGIRDDSILQLQTGISTILKRQDTGSFIFAYKSDKYNFDDNELDDFINDISSVAARYLRNDSTTVHHITVDGSKLEMRTHSELMSKYREDVSKAGVMLVREIDRIPSTLAMAFHYFCDEYNPLVKNSAIFFTLDLTKCSGTTGIQQNTVASIEKCLASKWTGVPEANIRPLLTRVVSTVVDVTRH